MKSRAHAQNADMPFQQAGENVCNHETSDCDPTSIEPAPDADDTSDLDEADLNDSDDTRWDVFILDDDDCDPLPDYGDFWMPD